MQVSIEEKQKSLYAALIRYSSDARTLRERAVDHLVIIALQDIHENKAMTSGEIRKSIGRGLGTEGLIVEVVIDSLDRLLKSDSVSMGKIRYKNRYFITDDGGAKLKEMSELSENIINPCIDRMLLGYEFNGNKNDCSF